MRKTNNYPVIRITLYEKWDTNSKSKKLLHQFDCLNVGEFNHRTCKAFYVDNYKSFNDARPIKYEHSPDVYISYKKYDVSMESMESQQKFG